MNYNTLLEDLAYYEGEIERIESLTDEEYAAEAGCSVMCPYPWGEGKSEREVTSSTSDKTSPTPKVSWTKCRTSKKKTTTWIPRSIPLII